MSVHPLRPLQVALYQAMMGDTALMAKVTGVYDHVPLEAVLPYIVFDDVMATRWDVLDAGAYRCEVRIDVHSRQGGRKELMEIVTAVQALLHHQPLAVDGFDVGLVEVGDVETQRENDGITTLGRVRVRCFMTESL